jgi:alpha-L-fucosidase 2
MTDSRVRVFFVAAMAALFLSIPHALAAGETNQGDLYDVVWNSPSLDSSGSMPTGNGDIGLNVWVERGGDLLFYIGKTDAWDENARLAKLGKVRVRFDPNPFAEGRPFRQVLRLRQGEIEIRAGRPGSTVTIRVWVDANQPVVRVEADGEQPLTMRASLEVWRTKPREIKGTEAGSAWGLAKPLIAQPDTVLPASRDRVVWYHRVASSLWRETLDQQGLGDWADGASDPMLNLTFGGLIRGRGLVGAGDMSLRSSSPGTRHLVSIYALTAQTATPEEWVRQLEQLADSADRKPLPESWKAHLKWWGEFWDRSWIRVSPESQKNTLKDFHPTIEYKEDPPPLSAVAYAHNYPLADPPDMSRGYALQRYVSACAGRGAFPIKFNGSIFNVDWKADGEAFDADYREWGGICIWQNCRLAYWPMLAGGDWDMMPALFGFYRSMLPFLKARTRKYFGHDGAYFPETMYPWGAYIQRDYGAAREAKSVSWLANAFIRYHFTGNLELLAMMLDYHDYTGDEAFLERDLLPMADDLILFWDKHFPRDEHGFLRMDPAQCLESYQDVVNPTPDIAGLHWVLDKLLRVPGLDAARKARWSRLLSEVPPVPVAVENGRKRILVADLVREKPLNYENPELYPVFPFRIYGVGKPDLDVARNTFDVRGKKWDFGWHQDGIDVAYLGLTDEVRRRTPERFARKHPGSRFDGFFGPNWDGVSEQCHGNNAMTALQRALMQTDDGKILLFPAWPKEWDVEFKLHAPKGTVVEGVYKGGALRSLKVTPESRRRDIEILLR